MGLRTRLFKAMGFEPVRPRARAYQGARVSRLTAVQTAIRAIISGQAKQYSIGSRSFTKLDLGELMERESSLKAEVKREQMADLIANGQGNPHNLFVRF